MRFVYMHIFICIAGMSDVQRGPYPVILKAGELSTSVTIPIINDEQYECTETFTADIIVGEVEGYRLGLQSSTTISITDDEGKFNSITLMLLHCMHSTEFPTYSFDGSCTPWTH